MRLLAPVASELAGTTNVAVEGGQTRFAGAAPVQAWVSGPVPSSVPVMLPM